TVHGSGNSSPRRGRGDRLPRSRRCAPRPGGGRFAAHQADKSVEVSFSYSHRHEALRDQLADHLSVLRRNGVINAWHDRRITAGDEWRSQIDAHLESADIILLLVSASFLASDYCYDIEMKRALEHCNAGAARVIPIILRPVDWHGGPYAKLQALPRDA